MQGGPKDTLDFIKSQSLMQIPYYQRNYDWNKDNCITLADDLIRLTDDSISKHFFGSIVVKPGNLSGESIIIDGQQRLTTTSLIILAIYNYCKEFEVETDYDLDIMYSDYLVNKKKKGEEIIKLKSNPRDYEAYKLLFGDPAFYKEDSNITRNYKFFYDKLSENNINVDSLIESLEKLEFIEINLNSPDDDAQLIFESLNSTGLDLAEADKIRNFLLMNETIDEQNYLYDTYWKKLEDFTSFDLDNFFRDYLTVKNSNYPNKNKVYIALKKYYNENFNGTKREFFDDLLAYGLTYKQINTAKINDNPSSYKKLNRQLYLFNNLNVNVLKPFLMPLLNDLNNGILDEDTVLGMFKIVESYIARRMITGEASNALNKVFATLYKDIQKRYKEDKTGSSLVDITAYVMVNKSGSAIFPTDEMLRQSFMQRDFYHINNNFKTFLFERLENNTTVEIIDIYNGLKSGDFSIEHIMPQKLNDEWRNQLGDNFREIHEKYLHSIGNLTITGYNSKMSNRSFKEKKYMEDGFNDSKFNFLNSIPASSDTWGEEEIEKRTESIIDRALEIWQMPESNYRPVVEENELIPFIGESDQFTNYTLKGYTFIDDTYHEEDTWLNLYIDVIKTLYDLDPNPINEAVEMDKNSGTLGYSFRKNADSANRFRKITDNVYLRANVSNWDKFNTLMHLFDKYELSYDSLMVDATLPESK